MDIRENHSSREDQDRYGKEVDAGESKAYTDAGKGGFVMRRAIKKSGKIVVAYELGKDSREIDKLIASGKIRRISEMQYEVFSQEAINGEGEKADNGDFIKLDIAMNPYPNKRAFFLKNHRHIKGYEYEQIPKPVFIWQADEKMCSEVEFLVANKGLIIDDTCMKNYFSAPLWGTILSAARNAYIVFYEIQRNSDGDILDIDFNFVENKEFEITYHILGD